MDILSLKNYILENNSSEQILLELGMHNIKYHDNNRYITCSYPDGDNQAGCILYLSDNLNVVSNTRDLGTDKSDIFTLVEFINKTNFFQSMKWVCEVIGLDYYHESDQNLPESIRLTKMLMRMKTNTEEEDDTPIKPIDEKVLEYYKPYVNDFWYNDNVPYSIQKEFELMYDESTNRIVWPIRDETGVLCGIKGRLFKKEIEEWEQKFLYLEPCPRNKILYGYYKTAPFTQKSGRVFCFEAEKSVHQLWAYGYKNSIAFMGKKVGQQQINKLSRLNCEIILALDQDVSKSEVEKLANRFVDGINVWAIYDEDKVLEEKMSPADDPVKWEHLVKNNIYKIR